MSDGRQPEAEHPGRDQEIPEIPQESQPTCSTSLVALPSSSEPLQEPTVAAQEAGAGGDLRPENAETQSQTQRVTPSSFGLFSQHPDSTSTSFSCESRSSPSLVSSSGEFCPAPVSVIVRSSVIKTPTKESGPVMPSFRSSAQMPTVNPFTIKSPTTSSSSASIVDSDTPQNRGMGILAPSRFSNTGMRDTSVRDHVLLGYSELKITESDSKIKPTNNSETKTKGITLRPSVLFVGASCPSPPAAAEVPSNASAPIAPVFGASERNSHRRSDRPPESSLFKFAPLSTNSVSSSTDNNNSDIKPDLYVQSTVNGLLPEPLSNSLVNSAPIPLLSKSAPHLNTPAPPLMSNSAVSSSNACPQPGDEAKFVFGENLECRAIKPTNSEVNELSESKESQESEANGSPSSAPEKRKYEAITGEEDECNVLQIHCKLYSWDPEDANWKEKGKGSLRLNDKKTEDSKLSSRLVMRTTGSLKVILNSSLVVGMKFELSNETCLRFTNIEGIYLVKGKEKDIRQLYEAIDNRLRDLSKRMRSEGREIEDHPFDREADSSEESEARGGGSRCLPSSVVDDLSN